jgi:hypothetical protein
MNDAERFCHNLAAQIPGARAMRNRVVIFSKEEISMATDQRHHSVHPPTKVRPNAAVNAHSEKYTPPTFPIERAVAPNPNPSLGPVGVADDNMPDDDCDLDDSAEDCDDRKKASPTSVY